MHRASCPKENSFPPVVAGENGAGAAGLYSIEGPIGSAVTAPCTVVSMRSPLPRQGSRVFETGSYEFK
jgi:hypothetical protein